MTRDFYPFVEADSAPANHTATVDAAPYEARVAVYDDPAMVPRVVIVDPQDTRAYLSELTTTVANLAQEQGGEIPFMVIREVVENYIHAFFVAPTVSILDHGNTIYFSDQGPGISDKDRALKYGTTSATPEMRAYIRGVGSGLPIASQYMSDRGGALLIEDNLGTGTVVTLTLDGGGNPSRPLIPPGSAHAAQSQNIPVIGERGKQIIDYLTQHESVGPTDLARTYGDSQPTWSRELVKLDEAGILLKRGQKRYLTEFGRSYLATSSK